MDFIRTLCTVQVHLNSFSYEWDSERKKNVKLDKLVSTKSMGSHAIKLIY